MSATSKFSVEAIFKAVDEISAPISKIESRLLGLTKNTGAALRSVDSFNSRVHGGLMRVAGAAVAAGTAAGFVAVDVAKAGMGFEQQMADLGAVSLKTRDQIADLEAKARELGATTKFTATEVGAGMELMAKAGFENQDILKGITGMLSAAAAEGGDFAETAGHISNVLKGMGLQTSEAGKVADVLALASVRTNSSISSLGESMSNVSATARQFKIPLTDVVASVALLQDVGLDASVAGSAMNTMLTKLATPTDAVKAKMAQLGVKFQDAKGNMLPLSGVLGQLVKGLDKTKGNMKQVALIADLTGLRGQKAAQNLADMFRVDKETGVSPFEKLAKELEQAEGTAERMSKLRMDTLGGDIEQLGGSVDELKIRLFDMNKGPLRETVQAINKWVDANKDLIVANVAKFIQDVVRHMPEIVMWAKRIATGIAVFYGFSAAVKVATVAIEGYEVAIKLAALTTKAWRVGTLATGVALGETAQVFGVFNREAAAGKKGMEGLRAGLNAGELSKQINGINSLLGKGFLLGSALAVGLAFGDWLNTTFKLDQKINDIITKMTGLNSHVDKAGGRRDKPGMGPNEEQELGDGTVVGKNGEVLKYGTGLGKGGAADRQVNAMARDSFLREDEGFKKMRMNPMMRKAYEAMRAQHGLPPTPALAPSAAPQVVTPGERSSRQIIESNKTTREETEVTIKAAPGTSAEVTKKPTSGNLRTRVKLQPSGAF